MIKIIKPDWYVAANAASTLATASYDIYKDMKYKREAERNESLNNLKNHLKKELKGEENKVEAKGFGMRGGHRRSTLNDFSSQKEKMTWVRSIIRKKRGSGYRKKTQ